MKKEDRKKIWEEFREEYWDAFYESLVYIWILFATGVASIALGLVYFRSWKPFLTITLISIGAIFVVMIPVGIFLSLVKRYKNKKK